MDPAEYDYMFKLEDSLWWYVGMRRIVGGMLNRNLPRFPRPLQILDAGCGTGGALKQLEEYGDVTSFDFEQRAAEMYATRQKGRIAVASTDAIPFADASFDLVTSFDVVCQLDNGGDEAAMREFARVLKPGGTLLVRTPAVQALYGPHDVTLHTKHRYSTGEMNTKLQRAGLQPLETTYANTILFPIAVVRRYLAKHLGVGADGSDVRPVPAPLNTALTGVLALESLVLSKTRLPIGLSVIAMARKP